MNARLCGTLPATLFLRCASSRLLHTWHVRHNVLRGRRNLNSTWNVESFETGFILLYGFGMPKTRMVLWIKSWRNESCTFDNLFLLPTYFHVSCKPLHWLCLHLDDSLFPLFGWVVGGWVFFDRFAPCVVFVSPPTHLFTKTTQYSRNISFWPHPQP